MLGYGHGFGWAWFGPEDDPDESGTAWISIEPLNRDGSLCGDELCVIICRNYEAVKRENPDLISCKERDAQRIVAALNAAEGGR